MKDLGLSRGVNLPKPAQEPVNIGVSYRTDGSGTSHPDWDKKSVSKSNEIPGARPVSPVTLPQSLADVSYPAKAEVQIDETAEGYQAAVEAAKDEFKQKARPINRQVADARRNASPATELDDVSGLLITGAPSAVKNQGRFGEKERDAKKNQPKKDSPAESERDTRSDFEKGLLMAARSRGMPVLAVCAGSWRIGEAYNADVKTLDAEGRKQHHGGWDVEHPVNVQPGTMLAGTVPDTRNEAAADPVGRREAAAPASSSASAAASSSAPQSSGRAVSAEAERRAATLDRVNSTHWAAVAEDSIRNPPSHKTPDAGLRVNPDAAPPPAHPGELRASAFAPPEAGGTVEAIENRHGAPVMGIQWHPESYLPGMEGRDSSAPASREQAENLFRAFQTASHTYANRQAVNKELKQRFSNARRGDHTPSKR